MSLPVNEPIFWIVEIVPLVFAVAVFITPLLELEVSTRTKLIFLAIVIALWTFLVAAPIAD